MKKLSFIFLILSILLYSGCATIFSGTNESVEFKSEPNGAKVSINGLSQGNTPMSISLKKGKDYNIEFSLPGYESKNVRLTYSPNVGYIILDVVFGLVGVIVDAVTGAWNNFDNNVLSVTLSSQQK